MQIFEYADDTIILTYNTDLNLATYNLEQFRLLRPFTGQLKKQFLYYFGETFKLGCKDVLQSQRIRVLF